MILLLGSDGAAKLRIQRLQNLRASNHNICRHFKVVMFEFGMPFIFIIREVSIRLSFYKNHLKNILKDVNKNDRFHITVQG